MAVLPLGTTNNFARSLGLPLNVPAAVEVLRTGRVVDVDLGRMVRPDGETLFANMASIGLSVQVARKVPHELKRLLGRAAYALTAAQALPSHAAFQVHLSTDEGDHTFRTHQLNIANGRFHAGRAIAREASVDDGLLVVYRLGDDRRAGTSLATMRQTLTGPRRLMASRHFTMARQVRVVTDPVLEVDVDGEIRGRTPVTINVAEEALRVFAPARFVDT